MRIFVYGYYNKNNIGDEQYKLSIAKFFKTYDLFKKNTNIASIDYMDDNLFSMYIPDKNDILILGGGDVLNNYFIDKLNTKINQNNKNNKNNIKPLIIALSVGIPYVNIIETNKLDNIDYFFIRTKQDVGILKFIRPEKVFYIPDISLLLENTFLNNKKNNIIEKLEKTKKRIVTLCLSGHIYNENRIDFYNNIVYGIKLFIEYLIKNNYHVVLFPFDTNTNGTNDLKINKDVLELLTNQNQNPNIDNKITNITETMSYKDTIQIIRMSFILLSFKYHPCLFSIYNRVPFIPIYTTRKIDNLLKDIRYEHYYKLEYDNQGIPISLDTETLIKIFENVKWEHDNVRLFLRMTHVNMLNDISKVNDIILNEKENENENRNIKTIDKRFCLAKNAFQKYTSTNLTNTYSKLEIVFLTKIILYNLIGYTNSKYNYGLENKMFIKMADCYKINIEYNINDEWKWVIKDFLNKELNHVENENGLYNIKYINQEDYSNVHRSGWQYVYNSLLYNNNSNRIIVDLYVDRTFHWDSDINSYLGIIPYTKKWIGVIHHTFDTSFSSFNNTTLFKNKNFIESLKTCKCIIVLTKYLQKQIKKELKNMSIDIPVEYIYHPTETNVEKFNIEKFISNENKQIIHIGGWLRNIYSFYKLEYPNNVNIKRNILCSEKYYKISKSIVKGSYMNNYFPNDMFLDSIKKLLIEQNCDNHYSGNSSNPNCSTNPCNPTNPTNPNCSRNICEKDPEYCIKNNFSRHFYEDISKIINSVSIIDNQTNKDYDELLTKNIVFLNLVDASAINTLIECIVRKTPIIINRIEPVEEILGDSYPLYYENINEVTIKPMYSDINVFRKAHLYLKNIDNNKFHINTFISKFNSIVYKYS